MPKISVIIPVYNTGKYLAECLDSVIGQTFADIEIICVNDGSTDDSAQILKKYVKQDARIKVLTQKNSGVVVARNNGIAHASGDLIYPLDGDDKIAPETLQELYNAFIQHRGDVITSRVAKFGTEFGEMILPKPTKLNFCRENCAVNAALFRKSDFIAAGGYDTKYAVALEDYDLWLNFIYRQKLKFYRVPKKLFFYRIKDKHESRNWQHRGQHDKIIKSFHKKYPEMTRYIKIDKLLKPLQKIARFYFRIEDSRIKIFKIPVYRYNDGIEFSIVDSFDGHQALKFLRMYCKYVGKIILYTLMFDTRRRNRSVCDLKVINEVKGVVQGHKSLAMSLFRGFRDLKIPYLYNKITKHTKYVILLWVDKQDLPKLKAIKQKYPHIKMVAVPTACKYDYAMQHKFAEMDYIDYSLVASINVKQSFDAVLKPEFRHKVVVWPSGVQFPNTKRQDKIHNAVLCYYKFVPVNQDLTKYLNDKGIKPHIIEYGKYSLQEYKTALSKVDFVIFIQDIGETQGLSMAEAWAENRPTVIKFNNGGTCPYLTDKTGMYFKTQSDLFAIIDDYKKSPSKFLKQFAPYDDAEPKFSDKSSVKHLIHIFLFGK